MLQITLEKSGLFAASDGPEPVRGPGDAIIRVRRIGVCGPDLHAFAGRQPFFNCPRILGHELGGRIVFVGLIQGDVTFSDPNFHRRELTLCASRNSTSGTFREIISRIEAGRIDTTPWITIDSSSPRRHRCFLRRSPETRPY